MLARSGCTCLAALRCIITTRSHIYIRPSSFSPPPPSSDKQKGRPSERLRRGGESCNSIRLPASSSLLRRCCCCFTSRSKGGPITIGRQASYDSTIFQHAAHFFLLLLLPADALFAFDFSFCLFLVPDLPFQMYLVSGRESERERHQKLLRQETLKMRRRDGWLMASEGVYS